MTYIGIDPGAKGAVAVIKEGQAAAYPMEKLIEVLREVKEPAICCLEKVHSMPGQGVSSTFAFGTAYGFVRGAMEAFSIPYQEITPRKWKSEYGLNNDKIRSVEVCKKLFPKTSLLPSPKCRKDSDGMAEALLMAEYAKRKF